jgi:DDE superfamily endonuclease
MNLLPAIFLNVILPFQFLFSSQVWPSALVLLQGAILSPGKRTVTAALHAMGLDDEPHFQTYHRVLNRAVWSSRQVSHQLLKLLVQTWCPRGPIVLGIDDTIERRKGPQIKAKGIYRDAVRSSRSQVVTVSGLRWLNLMLLVEIPWAKRIWALPFLTVLAPSQRYHEDQGKCHKTLTDWARQMLFQVRRWLPHRDIIVVGDSSFAVLDFLHSLQQLPNPVQVVTRLRLDAALYAPPLPRTPGQRGRPAKKGPRLPVLKDRLDDPNTVWQQAELPSWYSQTNRAIEWVSQTALWYHPGVTPVPLRWVLVRDPLNQFEPQAFLCTDCEADPLQILTWFTWRWSVEVTYEEVRAHLGVETQRQWSDLAILRTTPALFGLFSIVTLWANLLRNQESFEFRKTAWYHKTQPTFSDALSHVRQYLWDFQISCPSDPDVEMVKIPKTLLDTWSDLLCYAA